MSSLDIELRRDLLWPGGSVAKTARLDGERLFISNNQAGKAVDGKDSND